MTRPVLQNTEVANYTYSKVETSFHNQQMEAQIKNWPEFTQNLITCFRKVLASDGLWDVGGVRFLGLQNLLDFILWLIWMKKKPRNCHKLQFPHNFLDVTINKDFIKAH